MENEQAKDNRDGKLQDDNAGSKNKGESKDRDSAGSDSSGESTKIYLTENSTLQTPEEEELDRNTPVTKDDDKIRVSNDDLHETQADRLAGSDRAGTSERKE